MKTVFAIVVLVIIGVIAVFPTVIALNLAGLPGALLADKPGVRSKARFIAGSIVAALGQSYVYLAYTAFVVNWTMLSGHRDDVVGWLLWPFALFAVMAPIWRGLILARIEAREHERANPQVEALHLTVLIAFIGLLTFAFLPALMSAGWRWVPYVAN